MFFGQMPRPANVIVVAHAVQKLLPGESLFTQINFVIVGRPHLRATFFGKLYVIKPGTRTRRIDVQLSCTIRLITRIAKCLRDGRHRRQRHLDRKRAIAMRAR